MGEALERIDMKAHRCALRSVRAARQRATPVHNTAARNQWDNQASGGSNVGDVRKQRKCQNVEWDVAGAETCKQRLCGVVLVFLTYGWDILAGVVGGWSQTPDRSHLSSPCDRCVDGTTKQSAGLSERGLALTDVSATVSVPPTGGGSPSRHPCGLWASEQAAAQLPMTPCN